MNNTTDLLFFTAVDNGYECFIPLYMYFANKYNPNSCFEFLVKNLTNEFEILMDKFITDFNIKSLKLRTFNNKISAHKLRFLEEPITKCNYTYIGDIDIFINENILPFHINEMNKYNTIYDNKLRLGKPEFMSGLHFVKTNEYFQQTKDTRTKYYNLLLKVTSKEIKNDFLLHIQDECLLKLIMVESNIKLLDNITDQTFNRPLHGLHISLHRKPFTNNMEFPGDLYKSMIIDNLYNSIDWSKLQQYILPKLQNILITCDNYIINNN